MNNQTLFEKVLSIAFLATILSVCVTLLILSFNSHQQREELQKSTDEIKCILLIQPEERNKESIKECDK